MLKIRPVQDDYTSRTPLTVRGKTKATQCRKIQEQEEIFRRW